MQSVIRVKIPQLKN